MLDLYFDGGGDYGDWLSNALDLGGSAGKNWWDEYQFDTGAADYDLGGAADYFFQGQTAAPQASPFDGYDLSSLGGDWNPDHGYGYNNPTSPVPQQSNWWDGFGSKAWSGAKSVLGSKWAVPLATGAAGALLQGSASKDESELLKKLRDAKAKGAQDYLGALEQGKTEAKSSYLQNLAGQKATLMQKIGRQTADSGGANPRRVTERFTRNSNEDYGKFLLNLMQSKTPDPSVYAAIADANVPAEDWWTGTKKGLASTLGTTTGSILQSYLANMLK